MSISDESHSDRECELGSQTGKASSSNNILSRRTLTNLALRVLDAHLPALTLGREHSTLPHGSEALPRRLHALEISCRCPAPHCEEEERALVLQDVHWVGSSYPSMMESYIGTASVEESRSGSGIVAIVGFTTSRRACRKWRRLLLHYCPTVMKAASTVRIAKIDLLAGRKRTRSAAAVDNDLPASSSILSRILQEDSYYSSSPCSASPNEGRSRSPSPPSVSEAASIVKALGSRLASEQRDSSLPVLGTGNNGVVYEVHLKEGGRVAAKLVHGASEHVQREVATLRSANSGRDGGTAASRRMVRMHDLVESLDGVGDRSLLLLEKLGCDIWYLSGKNVLRTAEIASIGAAMLDAVDALHASCKRLHKSVKPENVCLSTTNDSSDMDCTTLKLIDFGRSVPYCDALQQEVTPSLPAAAANHSSEPIEERFTGWWFSRSAMLGIRQGREDDMLSVLYSVGFLLDDAFHANTSSSAASSEDDEDYDHNEQEGSNVEETQSFVDCRHALVEFIDECFAVARRRWFESQQQAPTAAPRRLSSCLDKQRRVLVQIAERPWLSRHQEVQAALLAEVQPLVPCEGDPRYLPVTSLPSWWTQCLENTVARIKAIQSVRASVSAVHTEVRDMCDALRDSIRNELVTAAGGEDQVKVHLATLRKLAERSSN